MKRDKKNIKPVPCIEWQITDFCNYRCKYCYQKQYDLPIPQDRHASDKTINRVLRTLEDLPDRWIIRIIGGEAILHPRFFDICKKITKSRHVLNLGTNFSLPKEKLQRLVDICEDKLDFVTASLHLSQANVDDFIKKAMWFNSIKHPNTSFVVVSPIIKDKFSEIKEVKKRLNKEGVMFRYQVLKENGRSIKYPDYMRNEISRGLVKSTNKIKDGSFFGKKCHAGHLFFIVKVNGDAFRCYETQPNSYLGNIATGTFKRNLIPLPCLSFKCTCRLPYINNIILFKEKERPLKLAHYLGRNLIKDKIFQKKLLNKSINFLR